MPLTSEARIERYDQRGFFLHIPFPREENTTVLYVADRDFENLHEIIDDEDQELSDFRDEIQELLDHSGHEGEHDFSDELTRSLMTVIENEDPPEDTEIDDPLDELTPDPSTDEN